MTQLLSQRAEPLQTTAPGDTRTARRLAALGAALLLGGWVVWLLRQAWAKDQWWPWLALLAVLFGAAGALRRLEAWLPGDPVLPRLAGFRARPLRWAGLLALVLALGLGGLAAWRLWPQPEQWQGTPILWAAGMLLALTGAWLLGGVGRAAPRAAAAQRLWSDSARNRWLEAAAFALILALAVFLRAYRIESIPPGIYVDETNAGLDGLYILEGRQVSPFGSGWYGTPNGYLYYMAGVFKLLGANWIGLKVVSLIPAILTVPAVYLLGRLMFGPLAGLCAMLLMAVSRWHLSMSRWGWNETAPPLFQVLATFFLIRGLRDRRALDYALSGLLSGLSIYTYLSARLALLTIAGYVAFWLLTDPSGWRSALRRSWGGLAIALAVGLVVVAPLGVGYLKDPFSFGNRTAEISVLRDIREQGSLEPLVLNLTDMLKFFHQTGDHQGKHNLPDEPMADPITGLLFGIGLAYALIAWRDQRRGLLLLWLALGLAGSFLSSHHESPQSYRSLTALPAVVLLAADVLDRLARAAYRGVQEAGPGSTRPYLPAAAAGAVAALALAGAAAWEAGIYFGRQAASIEVARGYNPSENGVAREVIAALAAGQDVYLSPKFYDYSPLRFLVYGVVKAQTGQNTLDERPYRMIQPEVSLPLPDRGRDTLILLDSEFWPLRGYLASFYPQAQMDLVRLADDSPVYMRVRVAQSELAGLQGLAQTITYADGRAEKRAAPQVEWKAEDGQVSQVVWEGSLRLERGGEYELRGEGGLEVLLEGAPFEGERYLGRGLYRLRVTWKSGMDSPARLDWMAPGRPLEPVPPQALFRVSGHPQGLLGTFWRGANWEGAPIFQQVTPILLLAWPDEQPVMPAGEFSARFSGLLNVPEPGTYTFRVEADDGARLSLDGGVLAEGLTPGQPNDFEASIDLLSGQHPIQIDYFQQGGGSALRLFWRRGDEPLTPIPPAVLSPAGP